MVRIRRWVAAAAMALIGAASGAQGAAAQLVSTHEDWRVYVADEGDERICYAVSDPIDKAPRTVDHGRVAFMLASWRSGAAIEQPSFHAGYQLKPGAPTRARVGSARYKMFVDGREGFVEDVGDERRLIRDMKRAFVMRVEAVSVRGTATAYEFSLKGVTNALRAMQNECR